MIGTKMGNDPLNSLLQIMEKLRDPDTGCPWDKEQNFESIAPYPIEEAYEVADTISEKNYPALKDELGDLLFQVVFLSQLAKEKDYFDFYEVIQSISEKMIRRHPHVFGNESIETAEAQTEAWEKQKELERRNKASEKGKIESVLDDVPIGLPSLSRAVKLQKRAARVGFDWPDTEPVIEKMMEELVELSEALNERGKNGNNSRVEEEFGDLLFVCANLARHLKVNPEEALRLANKKFIRRFNYVEESLNYDFGSSNLEEMEVLWNEAKVKEKS